MKQKEKKKKTWLHESYRKQERDIWPGRGNHILAQYDEDSVVVYQAYKKEIADYAVKHQKFTGCKVFGEKRMTWIKPNFMWMMFRSKWGSKANQTNILAIWLKRKAFEWYLENAREQGSVRGFTGTVRLQWDPDHDPRGKKHVYRRALQLGMRGVTTFINGEDIVWIEDISEFVHAQGKLLKTGKKKKKKKKKGAEELLEVSRERIFVPNSELAAKAVNLSPPPSM